MFGVIHNYADELSSSDHGVHLCSVLYTIMPTSLAWVIMVFTYVRCCTQLCRWTSSFVSPLLVCKSTCKKSHVHLFIVTYSHRCPKTVMNKYMKAHVVCRDSDGDIEHGPREVISGPRQFPGVLCCRSVRGV